MIVQLTFTSALAFRFVVERHRHSRHISTLKQQFVAIHMEASATFKVSVFTLIWVTPSICHHFGLYDVKQSNKSEKRKLLSGFIISFIQILYNHHHLYGEQQENCIPLASTLVSVAS